MKLKKNLGFLDNFILLTCQEEIPDGSPDMEPSPLPVEGGQRIRLAPLYHGQTPLNEIAVLGRGTGGDLTVDQRVQRGAQVKEGLKAQVSKYGAKSR